MLLAMSDAASFCVIIIISQCILILDMAMWLYNGPLKFEWYS